MVVVLSKIRQHSRSMRQVTSGGFRDYGARGRNHSRGPCLKIFLIAKIILQDLFIKIVMPQGCIQMFSCDFFSIFLRCGAPLGLPKVRGLGPWPLAPLKAATASNNKKNWYKLAVIIPFHLTLKGPV